jgi:hypothetical protein
MYIESLNYELFRSPTEYPPIIRILNFVILGNLTTFKMDITSTNVSSKLDIKNYFF